MRTTPYPWQEGQWTHLARLWRHDRLPHALLFTGIAGMGKYHLAQCLQRHILCQSSEPTCGHCSSCHWLLQGYHPDAFYLAPEEEGKAIKVDAVRQWMEQFQQSAHQRDGYRTALIHPAHALNTAAANSLLKTLEEPPAKRVIILITDCPSRLPATLRSRCQVVHVGVEQKAAAEAWLKQELDGPIDGLLSLAEGAPLRARRYAQEKEMDFRQTVAASLLAVQQKKQSPSAVAEAWHQLPQQRLKEALQAILCDMLRLKGGGGGGISNVMNDSYLQALVQGRSWEQLFRINTSLLEKIHWRSQVTGLNDQLLWERFLIEWCE